MTLLGLSRMKRRACHGFVGLLAAGLFGLSATPALARNIERGQILAQQWCAQCHLIGEEQNVAGDAAPSFRSLANNPENSTSSLTVWLTAPHPPMPDLQLGQEEIEDLVAYIQSLGNE